MPLPSSVTDAFAVWMPVFIERFDAGEGQTAMVQSIGMSIMTLMGFLNGPVIQILGYRGAGMVGGLVRFVSVFSVSFCLSPRLVLYFLRVLLQIFAGAEFAASYSESIGVLMLTYGVIGGVGYWLIMAPCMAIVAPHATCCCFKLHENDRLLVIHCHNVMTGQLLVHETPRHGRRHGDVWLWGGLRHDGATDHLPDRRAG